jgi:hypothetical protein
LSVGTGAGGQGVLASPDMVECCCLLKGVMQSCQYLNATRSERTTLPYGKHVAKTRENNSLLYLHQADRIKQTIIYGAQMALKHRKIRAAIIAKQ